MSKITLLSTRTGIGFYSPRVNFMISSVDIRPFQIPRTVPQTLLGSFLFVTGAGGLPFVFSNARARISRASASIARPFIAACTRSFCFTSRSNPRIVNVALLLSE